MPVFILYVCIFKFIYMDNGLLVLYKICMPIFIGLFLAVILNPIMTFFEKGLNIKSRYLSITFTFVCIICSIILVILIISPSIINSISRLKKDIPTLIQSANNFISYFDNSYHTIDSSNSILAIFEEVLAELAENFSLFLTSALNLLLNKAIDIFSTISNIIVSITICIYILLDKENLNLWIQRLCYSLFDIKVTKNIVNIIYKLYSNVSSYICAKIIGSFITGIFIFIGANYIIQTPYPIIDAIVIGCTNMIPYFGLYIGIIPITLINILYNPHKGFLIFILTLIVDQIDGIIISPKIISKQLSIKPIIMIISITIGGGLFGFIGLFLSIPTSALISSLLDTWIEYKLVQKNIYFNKDIHKKV